MSSQLTLQNNIQLRLDSGTLATQLRKLYHSNIEKNQSNLIVADDEDEDENNEDENNNNEEKNNNGSSPDSSDRFDSEGNLLLNQSSAINLFGSATNNTSSSASKVNEPAAMHNLHKVIQRRRKVRYEAGARLMKQEKKMLPPLDEETEMSPILEDVLRRQGNQLASQKLGIQLASAASGPGAGAAGLKIGSPGETGGGEEVVDEEDPLGISTEEPLTEEEQRLQKQDQSHQLQQQQGEGEGEEEGESAKKSPPRSTATGSSKDHLPSIMRGMKVDLSKAAEQAAQAKQLLLDTKKSLSHDASFLLAGAVHNSHESVKKFHAFYTHAALYQEIPPLPTLPNVENTRSHRARGVAPKNNENNNKNATTARAAATTTTTTTTTTKPLGTLRNTESTASSAQSLTARKPTSSSKQQHHSKKEVQHNEMMDEHNKNKNQAVQFLFMTECRSPHANAIVLPEKKTSPLQQQEQQEQEQETEEASPAPSPAQQRKRIPHPPPKVSSSKKVPFALQLAQQQVERDLSISSDYYTPTKSHQTNRYQHEQEEEHQPQQQDQNEEEDQEETAKGTNGDSSSRSRSRLNKNKNKKLVSIEDLLSFNQNKNVDRHQQSYRELPTSDSQPKYPNLPPAVGTAKKIRKFMTKVNTSAVDHGRYGLTELRRAWAAQQEFRENRKHVMNKVLDNQKLQFTAPQAILNKVRAKMKAVATTKDHEERIFFFKDHIEAVRPYIEVLFPKKKTQQQQQLQKQEQEQKDQKQQEKKKEREQQSPSRETDQQQLQEHKSDFPHIGSNFNVSTESPPPHSGLSTAPLTPTTSSSPLSSSHQHLHQHTPEKEEKHQAETTLSPSPLPTTAAAAAAANASPPDDSSVNSNHSSTTGGGVNTTETDAREIAHNFLDELWKEIWKCNGLNGLNHLEKVFIMKERTDFNFKLQPHGAIFVETNPLNPSQVVGVTGTKPCKRAPSSFFQSNTDSSEQGKSNDVVVSSFAVTFPGITDVLQSIHNNIMQTDTTSSQQEQQQQQQEQHHHQHPTSPLLQNTRTASLSSILQSSKHQFQQRQQNLQRQFNSSTTSDREMLNNLMSNSTTSLNALPMNPSSTTTNTQQVQQQNLQMNSLLTSTGSNANVDNTNNMTSVASENRRAFLRFAAEKTQVHHTPKMPLKNIRYGTTEQQHQHQQGLSSSSSSSSSSSYSAPNYRFSLASPDTDVFVELVMADTGETIAQGYFNVAEHVRVASKKIQLKLELDIILFSSPNTNTNNPSSSTITTPSNAVATSTGGQISPSQQQQHQHRSHNTTPNTNLALNTSITSNTSTLNTSTSGGGQQQNLTYEQQQQAQQQQVVYATGGKCIVGMTLEIEPDIHHATFKREDIHLEHVVNLLALVAPLSGASEDDFANWVQRIRKHHENRDRAVVVEMAKKGFTSADHIDANFALYVYSVTDVSWVGLNPTQERGKAQLRFEAEKSTQFCTPKVHLKSMNFGDARVAFISLQDHRSTIRVELVLDGGGDNVLADGSFSVENIAWKRHTLKTVELIGTRGRGKLNIAIEMDFPHCLAQEDRRRMLNVNPSSSVPLPASMLMMQAGQKAQAVAAQQKIDTENKQDENNTGTSANNSNNPSVSPAGRRRGKSFAERKEN